MEYLGTPCLDFFMFMLWSHYDLGNFYDSFSFSRLVLRLVAMLPIHGGNYHYTGFVWGARSMQTKRARSKPKEWRY